MPRWSTGSTLSEIVPRLFIIVQERGCDKGVQELKKEEEREKRK
jgi:hypothetical protein